MLLVDEDENEASDFVFDCLDFALEVPDEAEVDLAVGCEAVLVREMALGLTRDDAVTILPSSLSSPSLTTKAS